MSRIITLESLDKIIEEKKELYQKWLSLKIISQSEYDQTLLTMGSIARLAVFHSTTDEKLEKEAV